MNPKHHVAACMVVAWAFLAGGIDASDRTNRFLRPEAPQPPVPFANERTWIPTAPIHFTAHHPRTTDASHVDMRGGGGVDPWMSSGYEADIEDMIPDNSVQSEQGFGGRNLRSKHKARSHGREPRRPSRAVNEPPNVVMKQPRRYSKQTGKTHDAPMSDTAQRAIRGFVAATAGPGGVDAVEHSFQKMRL